MVTITLICKADHSTITDEWGKFSQPCPQCGKDIRKMDINEQLGSERKRYMPMDFYDESMGQTFTSLKDRDKHMRKHGFEDAPDRKLGYPGTGTVFSFPKR